MTGPQCGAVGVRLNRHPGMCPCCTEELHVEEHAINELLRREAEGREEGSEHEVERCECARLWQQNLRLMYEHGLKGKRGRW